MVWIKFILKKKTFYVLLNRLQSLQNRKCSSSSILDTSNNAAIGMAAMSVLLKASIKSCSGIFKKS